jgi:hypothetical protein
VPKQQPRAALQALSQCLHDQLYSWYDMSAPLPQPLSARHPAADTFFNSRTRDLPSLHNHNLGYETFMLALLQALACVVSSSVSGMSWRAKFDQCGSKRDSPPANILLLRVTNQAQVNRKARVSSILIVRHRCRVCSTWLGGIVGLPLSPVKFDSTRGISGIKSCFNDERTVQTC